MHRTGGETDAGFATWQAFTVSRGKGGERLSPCLASRRRRERPWFPASMHAQKLLQFRRLWVGEHLFRPADLVDAALMHEDDA